MRTADGGSRPIYNEDAVLGYVYLFKLGILFSLDKYSVMGLLDHMVDLERFLELGYRELWAFQVVLVVKNSPANAGDTCKPLNQHLSAA